MQVSILPDVTMLGEAQVSSSIGYILTYSRRLLKFLNTKHLSNLGFISLQGGKYYPKGAYRCPSCNPREPPSFHNQSPEHAEFQSFLNRRAQSRHYPQTYMHLRTHLHQTSLSRHYLLTRLSRLRHFQAHDLCRPPQLDLGQTTNHRDVQGGSGKHDPVVVQSFRRSSGLSG